MKYTAALLLLGLACVLSQDQPCYGEYSPNTWSAIFQTTQGNFTININRGWAAMSADRFYQASHCGVYKTDSFFWNVAGQAVWFGYSGDPTTDQLWSQFPFPADIALQKNTYGMVSFVQLGGYQTSPTICVINTGTNTDFDAQGYAPFGQISDTDMKVVMALYNGYGQKPDQNQILAQGNSYLQTNFPMLSYSKNNSVSIVCPRLEPTCQYIPGDPYAIQCCTGGEMCVQGVGCRCLAKTCEK